MRKDRAYAIQLPDEQESLIVQAGLEDEVELERTCCQLVGELVLHWGSARFRARGLSMLPAIWPGDVLTVRSCSAAETRRGDIVLYRKEGRLTAHRVVSRSDTQVVTRGDSVPTLDAPVEWDEVQGRVDEIFRDGRRVRMNRSLSLRAGAWLLRRSEPCTRMLPRGRAAVRRVGRVFREQAARWKRFGRGAAMARPMVAAGSLPELRRAIDGR